MSNERAVCMNRELYSSTSQFFLLMQLMSLWLKWLLEVVRVVFWEHLPDREDICVMISVKARRSDIKPNASVVSLQHSWVRKNVEGREQCR